MHAVNTQSRSPFLYMSAVACSDITPIRNTIITVVNNIALIKCIHIFEDSLSRIDVNIIKNSGRQEYFQRPIERANLEDYQQKLNTTFSD
jgi:hypothetical protein